MALLAEIRLTQGLSAAAGLLAGSAWALALWTSLYEPGVLFVISMGFWVGMERRRFSARAMRPGWLVFALLLATAVVVDGWRVTWPDAALRESFIRWQRTIGEMAPLDLRAPLLYRWLGVAVAVAPLALGAVVFWRAGDARRHAAFLLVLLLAALALTVWQIRWGYFAALTFALTLPVLFALPASRESAAGGACTWHHRVSPVAVALLFLASLWPLASDWDEKLFPEDHPELELDKQLGVVRIERVRLREVAAAMRGPERSPFLAPWWLSPALAYWSGQPGVAGSSHESLPGIVASARFYLAKDAAVAARQARELGVRWVVTDDGERMEETSRVLLGLPPETVASFPSRLHSIAEPRERVREEELRAASPEIRARLLRFADEAEAAHLGTADFSCISTNQFYKLFALKPAQP